MIFELESFSRSHAAMLMYKGAAEIKNKFYFLYTCVSVLTDVWIILP